MLKVELSEDVIFSITSITMKQLEEKFGGGIHSGISDKFLLALGLHTGSLLNAVNDQLKEVQAGVDDPDEVMEQIIRLLLMELKSGDAAHGLHCCSHQGVNVIREEFEELWEEFREKKPSEPAMIRETVQLGAMCIKMLRDILLKKEVFKKKTYTNICVKQAIALINKDIPYMSALENLPFYGTVTDIHQSKNEAELSIQYQVEINKAIIINLEDFLILKEA